MHLSEYLRIKKIYYKDFAELIDYSTMHVYNIMKGKTKCNRRLATLISKATQGEVSIKDMMSPPSANKVANPISPYEEECPHPVSSSPVRKAYFDNILKEQEEHA